MTKAYTLYRKHTQAELQSMYEAIQADPANKSAPGELHLYIPAARKKMDDIKWAIQYHLQDKKEPA